MIKLYEVFSEIKESGLGREKLACLDVTENSKSERVQILADLKTLYGLTCQYVDHDCGHDEGKSCNIEEIS